MTDPNCKGSTDSDASPADALNAFFGIVQDHVSSATSSGRQRAAWRGPNAEQYSAELHALKPHYAPILWGVGCSVVSFAAFRLSGAARLSRATGGGGGGGGTLGSGYRLGRINAASSNEAEAKSRLLGRMLSIPVDFLLSFLIGCSATLFLTDTDKLGQGLAQVPLVPGRSLVSDELCSDFALEYNKWPQSMWTSSKVREEHPSVCAIHDFVRNCAKRKEYERTLRQDTGLGMDDPIAIPSPGVPRDSLEVVDVVSESEINIESRQN